MRASSSKFQLELFTTRYPNRMRRNFPEKISLFGPLNLVGTTSTYFHVLPNQTSPASEKNQIGDDVEVVPTS